VTDGTTTQWTELSMIASSGSHVSSHNRLHSVDLYSVEANPGNPTTNEMPKTVPFIHPIELRSTTGEVVRIRALFDDGAMTSAMCTTVFSTVKHRLKGWKTSTRTLRMANGAIIKAEAEWAGTMTIKDVEIKGSFLVFDSGGGWAFLLGKPLLRALRAVHDYSEDTITISDNKTRAVLANRYHDPKHLHVVGDQRPTLDVKQVTQTREHKYSKWI